MPRNLFDHEILEVKNEVLLLGKLVEEAVLRSVQALKDNDLDRSRLVIASDVYINRKRYEIELFIITLIATQQPVSRDLRLLAASLDVCNELERIGDYAKGIANINLRSAGLSLPTLLREIQHMAGIGVSMLNRALQAFVDLDLPAARALILEDDVVDECYTKLYTEAVNTFLGDPRNIERSNYVIWVAHNLERLGDRVTNICERTIYIVTGERSVFNLTTGQLSLPSQEDQ